ncbi:Cys-tRNA(Pro) deacylase [Streptomonospora litoralis]|uniref:Cys-tRNA(Pro)/Cys-tRNA(Cys) deacylase n=1 Tax=Streptomonospora litoralis TaxID=2498135 RepID=A0A4P6Q4Z0_9ACTN|nr:Cys-tRNA(Pro) deacylase [Streptomonospora litoralis]QBI53924.1 Cys-tRNA(Pro)/Cys-tRNA(Cys) deacylase YbaK [Streptomonospora litoralis]
MSGKQTPATVAAARAGIAYRLHTYETAGRAEPGSSYGAEAADALGVSPDRVFKTLVAEVDGRLTVGAVPVSGGLDLKALAAAAGGKRAAMADPADAERATGYVRGGISPLGGRKRLRTVVDSSVADHDTVFVSAGRRGLQMELSPGDLLRAADAATARITEAAAG